MRKLLLALLCLILFLALSHCPAAIAQSSFARPSALQAAPPSNATPSPESSTAAPQTPPPKVTSYTLPPDQYKKARALSAIRLRLLLIKLVYGVVVLLFILHWKLAPKYRVLAEIASQRHFLQALIFSPLVILTIDGLSLPTAIYENWVERSYGLSVQGWASWFWDWTKGEIISVILAVILIWILYAVIRKSPRRWWFYFWLVSLPIGLLLLFLQPLIIDPLFHKFEPLAQKDPALTSALQKMVQRAGENIPPERMFWMGAGEKTTTLNAYVAGFGASKRIVVWDTTIAKMNTPQIVFVTGHEMGHYVLNHIPKLIAFGGTLLFCFFYFGYRCVGSVLARWGTRWEIRGLADWASLPVLLLLLSIISTLAIPFASNFSRRLEHQADQYGLEVTHGLTPDSGQVAAQAFQILGEVDLADPEPNPVRVFLFYDHPAIPDRMQFSLHYDPWSNGRPPEFVR